MATTIAVAEVRVSVMSAVSDAPPSGLAAVLHAGAIRCVYQPIVDVESGLTVAFEALARGPRGHSLERPDALFAAARAEGAVADLDLACREAAVRGARCAGLADPASLFINVEPASLAAASDAGEGWANRAASDPHIVVEITERDVVADPVGLLRFVAAMRERGFGIALDDVGADSASLAMMPLLRPDVIKLDLRLVQQRPDRQVAEIFSAVNAETERSGGVVLAEGIETERHLAMARGLGATLGQGWLLGRPGPLTETHTLPRRLVAHRQRPALDLAAAPFDVAAVDAKATRTVAKTLLVEVSKHLEQQAQHQGESALIVATLQHARFFTPSTRERYRQLARSCAFVALLGRDLPSAPLPGVRGANLNENDPVINEWDVAVLGPHYAAALVARDLGDPGPDAARRFDYVLTHDRDAVVRIAAALLGRVSPQNPPDLTPARHQPAQ